MVTCLGLELGGRVQARLVIYELGHQGVVHNMRMGVSTVGRVIGKGGARVPDLTGTWVLHLASPVPHCEAFYSELFCHSVSDFHPWPQGGGMGREGRCVAGLLSVGAVHELIVRKSRAACSFLGAGSFIR